MNNANSKVYVAGHRGLVGSALLRRLNKAGYSNIVRRTHAELDLANQEAVERFFAQELPEYVFLAAAKVGGILANRNSPADFIGENLAIQMNVIDNAHRYGVKKLLFFGSSSAYPKNAPQPLKEDYLLTGPLEETIRAYSIAKIAGIELCQSYRRQHGSNFIVAMPTNLYGPNDNFDPKTANVLPSLIRRFHEAKETNTPTVSVWGSGTQRREFLHADDLATACFFLMQNHEDAEIVNVGSGQDVSIKELAEAIKEAVRYEGEIVWDKSKPDGAPRKLLDISKLHALGWNHSITLESGIRHTYAWYQNVRVE